MPPPPQPPLSPASRHRRGRAPARTVVVKAAPLLLLAGAGLAVLWHNTRHILRLAMATPSSLISVTMESSTTREPVSRAGAATERTAAKATATTATSLRSPPRRPPQQEVRPNEAKARHASATTSTATIPNNADDPHAACAAAYDAAHRGFTPGLTADALERSRAHVGNLERLDNVARTLTERQRPLTTLVFGGSISMGHGVVKNISIGSESYLGYLEHWLNRQYPLTPAAADRRHRVLNMAQHGTDSCSLAKRLNVFLTHLNETHGVPEPDLILLEYGVNDYQGQDHVHHVVSRLDVFFDGFQDIALCAEVVVHALLRRFPKAAVMFLEFRTAVPQRKTAQMLHLGVAQHYQVPMISYADAVFPEYLSLLSRLNASEQFSVVPGDHVRPFPFGCHGCRPEHIIPQFRDSFNPRGVKRCRTMCDIMATTGVDCPYGLPPPSGRAYCHPALFSADNVHPSSVGHRIAADLLAHAVAGIVRRRCEGRPAPLPHQPPPGGWLASPQALEARGSFRLVQDVDCLADHCQPLQPVRATTGFARYVDAAAKIGWIATNATGGEAIEFRIDLPARPCYAVYLAILRSYEGMGRMEVTVTDAATNATTAVELDGLWAAPISVWSDHQLTEDNPEAPGCTGHCIVRVRTHPQVAGRSGNKVKLLTLSARECVDVV